MLEMAQIWAWRQSSEQSQGPSNPTILARKYSSNQVLESGDDFIIENLGRYVFQIFGKNGVFVLGKQRNAYGF
jgi:hypothetical protein